MKPIDDPSELNDRELRVLRALQAFGGRAKAWEIEGGAHVQPLCQLQRKGFGGTDYDKDSQSNYWIALVAPPTGIHP